VEVVAAVAAGCAAVEVAADYPAAEVEVAVAVDRSAVAVPVEHSSQYTQQWQHLQLKAQLQWNTRQWQYEAQSQ
jgi:hypothetical protein